MRYWTLLILMAAVLLPMSAYGSAMTFTVDLLGSNEVPSTDSMGSATAIVTLDPVAQTLQVDLTFINLTSPTTAAHIHCCLNSPFATGVNVGVATTTPSFPGFPTGVTSGNYVSDSFDLTQASNYNPAFITAEGSLAQAEAALIAGIENGETYLNIHTMMNPGGEIRGFVVPAAGVGPLSTPEPGSLALLGSGLLGLFLVWRKRPSCGRSL
jgi:hypothetical protein